MNFRQFVEAQGPLYQQLLKLKPKMAMEAQKVYNSWEQDEEGLDDVLGGGGICDQISQAISSVIVENIQDVDITEAGQPGDDHSWIIAYNKSEGYHVDIPPDVYERGGGYNWSKIPGVVIQPNHIEIMPADLGDLDPYS